MGYYFDNFLYFLTIRKNGFLFCTFMLVPGLFKAACLGNSQEHFWKTTTCCLWLCVEFYLKSN